MKPKKPASIVVLYRGTSITNARVVAATSDPEAILFVAKTLLREAKALNDDALSEIQKGRWRALEIAAGEAQDNTKTAVNTAKR